MSNKRFDGKVVIVTGSSAGIGQQAALLFAKEGAKIVIHGRSDKGLAETQKLMKDEGINHEDILAVQGDISDEKVQDSLINNTIDKFGKIDVLVNNAGIGFQKDGKGPQDVDTLRYFMEVNVISGIRLLQLAAQHLEKTKGNCVYISSIVSLMAVPENPFYAVSKAALDSWTKTAAIMYSPKGIRVNSVNPGGVDTEFLPRMGLDDNALNHIHKYFEKSHPLGRMSQPKEQAEPILFLASEQASYVNGDIFVVDGGHLSFRPKIDAPITK